MLTFIGAGSVQKRKAKPPSRRHTKPDIPVPQSPRRWSDHSAGEYSNARDVPLHGLPAQKAKPSSLSSWILHHFHEKQTYNNGMEESRENSASPESHIIPTVPKAIREHTTTHVCAALEIFEDELPQL